MLEAFFLILIGSLVGEVGNTKIKKTADKLTQYQKSFIILVVQSIISFFLVFLLTPSWHFETSAISYLLTSLLIVLVVLSLYFAMHAIEKADRSTDTMFGSLVIPLLLISDVILGYNIGIYEIIGVLFITTILFFTSLKGAISLKGLKYILISRGLEFLQIVVFKYTITQYNTGTVQLFLIGVFSAIIFSFFVYYYNGFSGIISCFKKDHIQIGVLSGTRAGLSNVAYMFGPTSIVNALKSILLMFWGVIFGKLFFKEKDFFIKLGNVGILSVGILIMNTKAFANNLFFLTDINLSLLKGDINNYKQELRKDIKIKELKNTGYKDKYSNYLYIY